MTNTVENDIPVACADCPSCGTENVVARVSAARTGFNSRTEHDIKCKQCGRCFKLSEFDLQLRRKPKEALDAECDVGSLPRMD
jgi:transposase-like protein